MKKLIVATVITSVLVGCGNEEPTKFEQEKQLLAMKQAHERELARINSGNESGSNVPVQQETVQDAPQERTESQHTTSSTQTENSDSGFSGGEMLLAAAGGALAGYAVSEMLDNGMRSYQDEHGNTHYTDKNGKPVSKSAYEEKKKTSKVTKFKEKAKSIGGKVSDKTKKAVQKVKTNDKVQKAVKATKYQVRKGKVLTKKAIKKAKRKVKR